MALSGRCFVGVAGTTTCRRTSRPLPPRYRQESVYVWRKKLEGWGAKETTVRYSSRILIFGKKWQGKNACLSRLWLENYFFSAHHTTERKPCDSVAQGCLGQQQVFSTGGINSMNVSRKARWVLAKYCWNSQLFKQRAVELDMHAVVGPSGRRDARGKDAWQTVRVQHSLYLILEGWK